MKPLIVLLSSFVVVCIIQQLVYRSIDFQYAGRLAMAIMLSFTAVGHFIYAEGMSTMFPEIVPNKLALVKLSGLFELMLAIGLLLPEYHKTIGIILILFFVLLLPLNIRSAMLNVNYQSGNSDGPGVNYLWFRIPLQWVFIAWVYLSAIKNWES